MPNTPGSDYINETKDKISVSDPIDQQWSDPIDGYEPVALTNIGRHIKQPEIYVPTIISNLGYNQEKNEYWQRY